MQHYALQAASSPQQAHRYDFVLKLVGVGRRLVRRFFQEACQDLQCPPIEPERVYPAWLIGELGAILMLAQWEDAGLHALLEPDLPHAGDALCDLFARHARDGDEACAGRFTELTARIYQNFLDRLAWTAAPRLGAEVLLLGEADDRSLAALADFLWIHRPRPQQGS